MAPRPRPIEIDSVILRRSPVILVYRIVWVTVAFYALSAVAYPVVEQGWLSAGLGGAFGNRFVWSLLTLGAEALVIIALFLHWSLTTYEIRRGELVCRSGLLRRRMDIHSLKNMQTVYTTRGPAGTVFNYGTVRLFNPMSREEILLEHIGDPERYAQVLRQVLDLPLTETILRGSPKA